MKKIVIIPSAKLIPENMREFGSIPTILYPLNSVPMIDLLYEFYNKCVDEIWVATYEEKKLIHDYVKINKRDINIFDLEKLKDLSYTIKETIKEIKKNHEKFKLIINLADTYVNKEIIRDNEILYVKRETTDPKWTYFKQNNGIITGFIDKEDTNEISDYLLFIGVVSIEDVDYFLECLEKISSENSHAFFEALKLYSEKYPFNFREANEWMDIGHPDEYFDSVISVKARVFNHISIDIDRGIITKYSEDTNKFKGEIEWYLKLPKDIKYVSPRIFEYSLDINNLYISMEYYSYHTILDLFLYGNLSLEKWKKIFGKIKFILNDFSNYKIKSDKITKSLEDMYINKTIDRLEKLKSNNNFSKFFTHNIIINNQKYACLNEIIDKTIKTVKEKLLNIDTFNIIHGDMCFANMMIDDKLNFIKLIDPRGKFGNFDIYGDSRYELAKLFHSVDGKYDYIIKDLFDITIKDNMINYNVNVNKTNSYLFNCMIEEFSDLIGNSRSEIEIIEGLLFLSMIPLHSENINHQYAMLATGIEILSRWINIKKD